MATATVTPAAADFDLSGHGSIAILTPLTAAAQDWADTNISCEDWQLWGRNGIAVDGRYVGDLIEVILGEGFTLQ